MSIAEYDKDGVRFQYPENWRLLEASDDDANGSLTLESPGGGFWTLQQFPGEYEPQEVADQALESMQEEYEGIESWQVVTEEGVVDLVGYDLDFYCLDLIVQSNIRAFRVAGQTFLMQYQAEDREFDEIRAVFDAINHTLFENFGRLTGIEDFDPER